VPGDPRGKLKGHLELHPLFLGADTSFGVYKGKWGSMMDGSAVPCDPLRKHPRLSAMDRISLGAQTQNLNREHRPVNTCSSSSYIAVLNPQYMLPAPLHLDTLHRPSLGVKAMCGVCGGNRCVFTGVWGSMMERNSSATRSTWRAARTSSTEVPFFLV